MPTIIEKKSLLHGGRLPSRTAFTALLVTLMSAVPNTVQLAAAAQAQPALGASHSTSVVPVPRQWAQWSPKVTGASKAVSLSRRGRLVIRIRPVARTTTARFRIVLPAGSASSLGFRVSYSTPDSTAYVASGRPSRRIWSRSKGQTGKKAGFRRDLAGRRVLYVGLTRKGSRAPIKRPAFIVITSYHVAGVNQPVARIPDPGATVPIATVRTDGPAAAAYTGPRIFWGARMGGEVYGGGLGDAPYDFRTVSRFERDAGKTVSLIAWGQAWYDQGIAQPFNPALFSAVRQHGSIPIIDWSPWDRANGGYREQPDFQLQDVIQGKYDAYIRKWAADAAAWGHPFFIRYCHEMNGSWYPWSERSNGNSTGEFVAAWRHVHGLFEAAGADNVSWLWSPNEEYAGSLPLAGLYPGGAYVDWVGITGYNWGGPQWRTFNKAFAATYDRVTALAPSKPVMMTEIGSAEEGGSKAEWIQDAVGVRIPTRYPAVKGFVWWNKYESSRPWPIQSSPSAQAAFASAIASPYYAPAAFSQLSASPIPTP